MKNIISCLLAILLMAGAANNAFGQGRWAYLYSPTSMNPDGGSWQYLNGRGQIVANYQMLPSPSTRWANPTMIASAQQSVRTVQAYGKTVFSAQDAQGNDVYFEEDPRQVATAAAITRRSRVDSIRSVAEVRVWEQNQQLKILRKADRQLQSGRHDRATEAYLEEREAGAYSALSAIRDGGRVGATETYQPPVPEESWYGKGEAGSAQRASASPSSAKDVEDAYAAIISLRYLDSLDFYIYWEQVESYVNEASVLGTLEGHRIALERLMTVWQQTADDFVNPDWPSRSGQLAVAYALYTAKATSEGEFNKAIQVLSSWENAALQAGIDWSASIDFIKRSKRDFLIK